MSEPDASEARVAVSLVQRIAAGDAAAEGELIERYSRGLTFMLRRMTGSADLADDLHQETFRVVLERLRGRGLRQPERLAGFLNRTARNLFIGEYRKRARRRTAALDEAPPPPDPAPSQLRRTLRDEEAALVRRLIAELEPARDRQILYRFYLAEESKERICADLGLSSLHFNRVLHRARQRFKSLLERAEKRRRLTRGVA
ncbi:MAG: sigma-70 family RNA polymerase sigma factor [Acidobacteria bacterium]|nr:MAG: sigma-70 family RNA polymerase sigma factor [Acidobacteriota bacterium]